MRRAPTVVRPWPGGSPKIDGPGAVGHVPSGAMRGTMPGERTARRCPTGAAGPANCPGPGQADILRRGEGYACWWLPIAERGLSFRKTA